VYKKAWFLTAFVTGIFTLDRKEGQLRCCRYRNARRHRKWQRTVRDQAMQRKQQQCSAAEEPKSI